jgi:hypothetical protein
MMCHIKTESFVMRIINMHTTPHVIYVIGSNSNVYWLELARIIELEETKLSKLILAVSERFPGCRQYLISSTTNYISVD